MKRAVVGITSAALATLLMADGAVGQCCGDCNGDVDVTVDELITAVNFALGSPLCVDLPLARLPATGQTTRYGADTSRGENVPVPDDGTLRAGTALRFEDNGDGTVTDLNTGLMWEKKDLAGGLHDSRSTFAWSSIVFPQPVVIWDWLQQINSEGGAGFAGHSDWRIPNYKELTNQSLV